MEWPFCKIHNKPMVIMFIAGEPRYVCQDCFDGVLRVSDRTDAEDSDYVCTDESHGEE